MFIFLAARTAQSLVDTAMSEMKSMATSRLSAKSGGGGSSGSGSGGGGGGGGGKQGGPVSAQALYKQVSPQ